jgi:hypothetical protein
MRHITVRAFGEPPCHGEIVVEHLAPPSQETGETTRHRSLPIIGQGGPGGQGTRPAAPATVWRCQRCDARWDKEPLPDEAL